jgi:hypothetical protein
MQFENVAMAKAQLAAMPIDDPNGTILAREALALYQENLDAAAAKLEVMPEQARLLAAAIANVGAAQGPDQLAEAAARALEVFRQIAPEGEKLPAPLREAARALEEMASRGAETAVISETLGNHLTAAEQAANALAAANIAAAIEAGIGPAVAVYGSISNAYDAMTSLAGSAPGGGWLSGAISDAAALASNLWNAASAKASLAAAATVQQIPGGLDAIARGEMQNSGGRVHTTVRAPVAVAAARSSGGGASAARAEKDAVAELIAKLREEQEVLQETDPIKSEMLKYRKQLADATAAERAQVEQLITVEQQLKSVRELEDFAGQSTLDFLDAIVQKGGSAKDAMRSLLSSLIKVATQALITGQGPLAGILGIKGGLFAGLFGGGVQAKAEGGLITGAGGPRDDKVPLLGSAGEFVMTGRATKRYRPVLERMNAGADIPGFANGGLIGAARAGGGRSGNSQGAGAAPTIHINLHSATGNAEIERMVSQGVQTGLSLHDREILPGRVRAVMNNQRVSGR